jgi:thioredoxin-related protein
MKRVLLFVLAIVLLSPVIMSWKKILPAPAKETAEIHWITSIDELQAKMQQSPRKIYVDVYTGWCGWCKKMDGVTFTNPEVVKYINNNFYALKLDAERKDTIHFMGKTYFFNPQARCNTFAAELLKGNMSYPTSVLMLENFQSPTPIPGYHDVAEMELFLTFFGDNIYKHQGFEEYKKGFKSTWNHGASADMTPPPGHAN